MIYVIRFLVRRFTEFFAVDEWLFGAIASTSLRCGPQTIETGPWRSEFLEQKLEQNFSTHNHYMIIDGVFRQIQVKISPNL